MATKQRNSGGPGRASGGGSNEETNPEQIEPRPGDSDAAVPLPRVTVTIDFGSSLSPEAAAAMFRFIGALAETAGTAVGAASGGVPAPQPVKPPKPDDSQGTPPPPPPPPPAA